MARNPFIVAGRIPPELFCDRVRETELLTGRIENGMNVVLVAPRRMGKTGLIMHAFGQAAISEQYHTFFIDILHTTSLREFTYLLGRQVYKTLLPLGHQMLLLFVQALRSVSGKFGFNPMTGLPEFNLELGDIEQPALTLQEILTYLEGADRPCIVAIDEFQQIARYGSDKNVEALLRTHIQQLGNCRFIFAGSEYHMMQEMFGAAARPFYHSAEMLELRPIELPVYQDFVAQVSVGRHIPREAVAQVYHRFGGNTYAMQRTLNEVYSLLDDGETCTQTLLDEAVERVMESKRPMYAEWLSTVPERHKATLYAVAKEGSVTRPTSSRFIKAHKLPSASAVQHALRQLIEAGLVTRIGDAYSPTDPFFALWLRSLYG